MNLEQKHEIEALLHKAAYDLDERDLAGMESCFAEDTTVTILIKSSGVSEPMKGRQALMDLVRDRVAAQTDRRRHVITNIMIQPAGPDRARTISYLVLISIENGKAAVLTTGCYRDVVARRDGRWIIEAREIELDLPY